MLRYEALHDAIHVIDNDIKKEMTNNNLSKKKYSSFGLLNKDLLKKYPFLLSKTFDKNTAKNIVFNYKDLIKKNEDKDYSYIDERFMYCFPTNFIFINKDFMDIICEYLNEEIRRHVKNNFEFIIGGGCLIKKNIIYKNIKEYVTYHRYITLYNGIEEKEGNNTDFFLFIKDKNKREEAVNEILKSNLWNYFKKIKYNYKDEFKKIIDDNGNDIGYVVRVSDLNIIESYIIRNKIKEKKKIFQQKILHQIL